jgi:hypothetical protein
MLPQSGTETGSGLATASWHVEHLQARPRMRVRLCLVADDLGSTKALNTVPSFMSPPSSLVPGWRAIATGSGKKS